MWFEPIFLSGSLAVFKFAAKPLKFGGLAVAAAGGEMRSNYFKNRAPIYLFPPYACPASIPSTHLVFRYGQAKPLRSKMSEL